MTTTISKITRAGQITLPKKIRSGRAFAHAKAVMFEELGSEVVITPMRAGKSSVESDHLAFVEYTMRDWLDPENDNLFKLPKNL